MTVPVGPLRVSRVGGGVLLLNARIGSEEIVGATLLLLGTSSRLLLVEEGERRGYT